MTSIYRERLASHLTARLSPRSMETAREMRRALYPALTFAELREQYVAVISALRAGTSEREEFLRNLADDLVQQVSVRGASA